MNKFLESDGWLFAFFFIIWAIVAFITTQHVGFSVIIVGGLAIAEGLMLFWIWVWFRN